MKEGIGFMGNESITYQKITEFIANKNLSIYEEYMLQNFLDRTIKDDRKCLASAIIKRIEENDTAFIEYIKHKDLCLFILGKCFFETTMGTMEPEKINLKKICEFTREVIEEFGLKANEEILFMQMLQMGLNQMDDEKILKFSPDRMMYRKYAASKVDISYIRNPYSEEDAEKIMNWAKYHPADVRAQAVSLWFTKGLTLKDIVRLTKKECWGKAEERLVRNGIQLFCIPIRSKIVRQALNTHPPKVEYVFSVPNSDCTGWERLSEKGLLLKLKAICKKIGITYKPILINEAIKISKD